MTKHKVQPYCEVEGCIEERESNSFRCKTHEEESGMGMFDEDEDQAAVMAAETVRETKILIQRNGAALMVDTRALTTEETCVYPRCPYSRRTRGLCHGHHSQWRSYDRHNLAASEEDLMRRGLLLPEGTGGLGKLATGHDAFLKGSTVRGRASRPAGSV